MKTQSPLLGFNNNVRHKGRVFHIQTEDSGIKHPHVITHLFADGGRIVRSQKTSYAEFVGDEELQRKVRSLMQEQHKAMFIALRAGKFDHLLETVPITEPIPPERPSAPGRAPMESTVSIEIGNEGDPKSVVHLAPGQPIPVRPSAPGAPPSSPGGSAAGAPAPVSTDKPRPPPRAAALALTEPAFDAVSPRPATVPPPSIDVRGPDTEVVRDRPPHIPDADPVAEGRAHSPPAVVDILPPRGAAERGPDPDARRPEDRRRSPSQGLRRLTPPPPLPASTMPRPLSGSASDLGRPARPPSMIPPMAKALAQNVTLPATPALPGAPRVPAGVPAITNASAPHPDASRAVPRRNSGLLAALGALSSGAKAPSLGAAPPSGRPPPSSLGAQPRSPTPQPQRAVARTEPHPASQARPVTSPPVDDRRQPSGAPRAAPVPGSLDLDLQALERAAEQGNSPVYRQVRDFPPPPQALRSSPNARSITPHHASAAAVPPPPPSQGASVGNRYAPSRPAAIFGPNKPQEGSSIFGEDLISEKSLDEVILSYLAEDLDSPKK
jgi:hypothetical protein